LDLTKWRKPDRNREWWEFKLPTLGSEAEGKEREKGHQTATISNGGGGGQESNAPTEILDYKGKWGDNRRMLREGPGFRRKKPPPIPTPKNTPHPTAATSLAFKGKSQL